MTFELELRERLQREAATVGLPGRDPSSAARRATTLRRRRQLGAAAMVVVSATLIVGGPLLLADQDSDNESDVSTGTTFGLPATGPIDFDWQSSPQGLLWPTAFFQNSGVVYALSTEPGTPGDGDFDRLHTLRAVYRLADDGTWEPLLLGQLRAADLAGADGLLYAVSTGPGDGPDASAAYLSTSEDGGENWTSEPVASPAPPSDQVTWSTDATMSVETSGSDTLALVSHSFYPLAEELFPELQGPEADVHSYIIDDRGITLTKFEVDEAGAEVFRPSPDGEAVAADAEALAADADAFVASKGGAESELRTIAWTDLGVGGQDDLVQRQLFRRSGDGWEAIEDVDFGEMGGARLGQAAGKFTISGYGRSGPETTMMISEDGSAWAPVDAPADGRVFGIGDALVSVPAVEFGAGPDTHPVVNVSMDGGGSWEELDLTTVGVEAGSAVYVANGGPLGLALGVGPVDRGDGLGGPDQVLFTGDLQDWTSTDVAAQTGLPDITGLELLVGEDKVVVNVETGRMSQTATLVGTPVR